MFNNKHMMIFENNINWCSYAQILGNKQYANTFYFLLQTLNVPLRIGKFTPVWEPLLQQNFDHTNVDTATLENRYIVGRTAWTPPWGIQKFEKQYFRFFSALYSCWMDWQT